jgi:hypothetical protein
VILLRCTLVPEIMYGRGIFRGLKLERDHMMLTVSGGLTTQQNKQNIQSLNEMLVFPLSCMATEH